MFKYHIPTTYKIKKLRKKWNSNENLLFLDFDGVFFCEKEFPTTIGKRIDKLIEEYDLKIIISSSWRYDLDECQRILTEIGINKPISGSTTMEGLNRNDQILDYLKKHPFNAIIVIDDSFLAKLVDYQIKCTFEYGFTAQLYEEAKILLDKQITDVQ